MAQGEKLRGEPGHTFRPKIGLALGGGMARAFSHIGVLQVLEEAGIGIDYLAATSSGSIIGAFYAAGRSATEMARHMAATSWGDLAKLCFPVDGLVSAKPLEDYLAEFIGRITFDQLRLPLAIVATNLLTGEEVVQREGSLIQAIRASCSVPGIISPVYCHEHCLLVDGGLVDNIPVEVVRAMGADIIVAVDLNNFVGINERAANIFQIIIQSIEIMQRKSAAQVLTKADVVIKPDLGNLSLLALAQEKEFIARGAQAAAAAVPEILRLLQK